MATTGKKELVEGDGAPRAVIEHSVRAVRYPVLDSPAALTSFAQQAALELLAHR